MPDIWNKKCLLAPSLICLDHTRFGEQVKTLEECGTELLHVDILDGHFSPSLPLGLDTVRQLRKVTALPFDAHIMVTRQEYFIDELLDIGVSQLTFHAERTPHLDQTINRVKKAGVRAGIALMPGTSLSMLDYVLEKTDVVLLMLINPGYAGSASEKQVPYAMRKIDELRGMITSRGLDVKIELDGRVSPDNIKTLSGKADIFVMGSTCIKRGDLRGSLEKMAELQRSIRGEN